MRNTKNFSEWQDEMNLTLGTDKPVPSASNVQDWPQCPECGLDLHLEYTEGNASGFPLAYVLRCSNCGWGIC